MYIIIGIICTDPVRELCACLVLTSLAFLIPVRLFFNMGSCYGLVMIYIGLACISSLISGLIRAKLKKAPHDTE